MKETKPWFEVWFDTNEYHVLYGHRDEKEANIFIEALIQNLQLTPCKVLDTCCGSGRHVFSWANHGFDAHGFDLSQNSISKANARGKSIKNVSFSNLDLRKLKDHIESKESYDIVTNLFTSFGYFQNENDHSDVIKGFLYVLKSGGILILDYINSAFSKKNMIASEIQIRNDIEFHIERKFKNGFFMKSVSYTKSNGRKEIHTELVKSWESNDLCELLSSLGFKVKTIKGDYDFSEYHDESPRMIIIAEKQ
tara:strand:- start:2589 stop:3341 length:753 start_codon:yes stop_codon:yes gene_type:complete